MVKEWKTLFNNKAYFLSFACLLALTLFTLKLCSLFLLYNEARMGGYQLNDFVLNWLTPSDVSTPLFVINWFGIFIGMAAVMRTPKGAISLFVAVILIIIARSLSMFLVPLIPPEGIIPLRDSFLECSFYGDKVLLRDLFFSGHTASLAILFFFADIRAIKYFLGFATITVASLLLVQHVHYTIDILAAPFFAYGACFLGKKVSQFIYDRLVLNKSAKKAILT